MRRLWRDYFENLLIAVLLALFVRTFILTGYRVPTDSMAPNLIPGDFIFSFRLPYGIKLPLAQTKWIVSLPKRGEVVVCIVPDEQRISYVRRVIGLPGDRVEWLDGVLRVNGKALETKPISGKADVWQENLDSRSYQILRDPTAGPGTNSKALFEPVVVPPDQVFVMSDNRMAGDRTHKFGLIPTEKVEGRVELIWLSMEWQQGASTGVLPHFRSERMLNRIQ